MERRCYLKTIYDPDQVMLTIPEDCQSVEVVFDELSRVVQQAYDLGREHERQNWDRVISNRILDAQNESKLGWPDQ